ncbi:hypothetical protein OXX59_004917, partial [Metschnikowia pulcherrima]
QEASIIFDGSV